MSKPRIPREFLGAFKAGHRPSARPFIDEELAWILLKRVLRDGCERSRKHLEFITKFNNEYYKGIVKKGDPDAFHAKDEDRKACYRRQYVQQVDIFSRSPVSLTKKVSGF